MKNVSHKIAHDYKKTRKEESSTKVLMEIHILTKGTIF